MAYIFCVCDDVEWCLCMCVVCACVCVRVRIHIHSSQEYIAQAINTTHNFTSSIVHFGWNVEAVYPPGVMGVGVAMSYDVIMTS